MNLFIASVVSPNGAQFKSDKNGNFPVLLNVLSGKCPSKRVLSGTMAINMEIEPGNTYMFSWEEAEVDETYGRQFNFSKVKLVSALEIVQTAKELGEAQLIDANNVTSKKKEEVTEEAFDQKVV